MKVTLYLDWYPYMATASGQFISATNMPAAEVGQGATRYKFTIELPEPEGIEVQAEQEVVP